MKNLILFSIIFVFAQKFVFSQSDTPCVAGAIVAPNLPISAVCSNTLGTTVGATEETDADNGGSPSCGSMGPDVWYSVTVPPSGSINFETSSGSITDGVMSVYTGTCGAWTEIACVDDAGGNLMPEISVTSLTAGTTILVRFWQFGGGTGTFDICALSAASAAGNTTCSVPSPICSGSPINFLANAGGNTAQGTNPGNDYNCLATTPNPSWYYLQISQAGNLVIDITAGADIDYAIWGPFSSLALANLSCNSYGTPSDCSYSTSNIEQATVNGVSVGEVYILLVTNFANIVQTIDINEAAINSAATNCAIVPLPVQLSSFNAIENESNIEINWTTESEQNTDFFVLEHSNDGQQWFVIDAQNSAGNSTSKLNYSTIHRSPALGTNYYRLNQLDKNGEITSFQPIFVNVGFMKNLEVYPNPSQGEIHVSLSAEEIAALKVYDSYGKEVSYTKEDLDKKLKLSFSKEFSGIVFIHVTDLTGKLTVKRVLIQ